MLSYPQKSSLKQQTGAVTGFGGQVAVLHEAHLFQPTLEGRDGSFARQLPQCGGFPEAGGLVVQHDVVAVGNAHEVIAPRQGQQARQILNIILVSFHVVGIVAVAETTLVIYAIMLLITKRMKIKTIQNKINNL